MLPSAIISGAERPRAWSSPVMRGHLHGLLRLAGRREEGPARLPAVPAADPDGDLIGVRLPRSIVGDPVLPGRALLHLGDGSLITVAVPLD